ncbi:MAG: PilC/PilY family type IV pilus protein [Nitrospira sp.]|nr:PilC/PilY family type IV pilus protein [Nitrospira sp.]
MNSRNIACRGAAALIALAGFLSTQPLAAQTMDQYYSVPPFVADQVPPNIILLMDNSGSMGGRACDSTWCGVLAGGGTSPVNESFVASTTYSGFFDSLTCYTYDATNTRFDAASSKSSLTATCGASEWDGNFLNWATFRRFDAVKKALIGGHCAVTRAADGTCPASGSPARITIKVGQDVFSSSACCQHHTTQAVPSSGTNGYSGRVPTSATGGTPSNLYIHLRGGTSGMQGTFCVDNDSTAPASNATSCTDSDGFAESQYRLRLAVSSQPTGVIQQIGAQARFALAVFNASSSYNGMRILTGAGSRQSIDFNGSTVETFNDNIAAMVDAVEESYPATWTPLAESLYEVTRYVAQINSAYYPDTYVYPIAYSPGVAFGASGRGSVGSAEITVLTGSETCPSGYITNACGRDPFFYGSNHTPAWASTSTQVRCCKTFVIVFTDGEPTQDLNIPSGLNNYAVTNAPSYVGTLCTGNRGVPYANPPGATCNNDPATPSNVLLMQHRTDYNAQGFTNGSHYLDDVAYWAHINDLRPCNGTADGTLAVLNVTGHCLEGLQNVTVYTFYAFGTISGRELLMKAALLGGFEDTNGNNVPDLVNEWDKVINATGAPGSDGIPDNYFESSDVDDLQERLMATITSILRRSASGTSISVLATSASGEGSIYQAYFFTSDIGQSGNTVKWTGYTHALFIDSFGNFREDTDQDGVLNYSVDRIVTTRYDDDPSSPTYRSVLVDKYEDLNGDGLADSTTPVVLGGNLKSIIPIWEAGKELALTPSSSRRILTWVDVNNNGLVDPGEQMDFGTTNCTTLRDYLRYAGDTCTGSSNAMNLINFIRGDEVAGLRTRMIEVPVGSGSYHVWKLGDPIHSTPTIVGPPKERYDLIYGDATYNTFYQQYRNRRQVAYVGANDGMLHAFNAGFYHRGDNPATTNVVERGWFTKTPTDNSGGPNLGAELWAFIPYQLLPQLQWLARADYSHVYYVDLKPKVSDVRIFTPDADHPDGWGTILIGGFRMGGSCGNCTASTGAPPMTVNIGGTTRTFYSAYFVLDITNPEVDPKLLWVFTDSGLGLTTAYPAITRVNPTSDTPTSKTNEKWYAIFGSGPNGYQADLPSTPSQTAKLYAVDLAVGPGISNSNVTTMPVGTWRSFMGHIITVDKDLDWRGDVAYMGRTIHDGALPWRGKLYRLTMSCPSSPCTPETWGISSGSGRRPTEVIDTFSDPILGTVEVGPLTAAPTVTIDDANKLWVFFGTGRYFGNSDKVDNNVQRLFGIKDSVVNGICTQTSAASCHDDDLVDVTNATVCLVCDGGTNQVTDPTNPTVTTFHGTGTTSMVGLVDQRDGWRVTLPTGSGTNAAERSVVSPTLIGGTVFFPTFVPTNDYCASTGLSYLYALYYKTGTAATTPVVGTTTAGANVNVTTKVALGVGLASSMSVQIGSQGAGNLGTGGTGGGGCAGGMTGAIQMSTGAATQPCASAGDYFSRYVSWVHQRD